MNYFYLYFSFKTLFLDLPSALLGSTAQLKIINYRLPYSDSGIGWKSGIWIYTVYHEPSSTSLVGAVGSKEMKSWKFRAAENLKACVIDRTAMSTITAEKLRFLIIIHLASTFAYQFTWNLKRISPCLACECAFSQVEMRAAPGWNFRVYDHDPLQWRHLLIQRDWT